MTLAEKIHATLEALGVFLLSVLPFLLAHLRERRARRRRSRVRRPEEPP